MFVEGLVWAIMVLYVLCQSLFLLACNQIVCAHGRLYVPSAIESVASVLKQFPKLGPVAPTSTRINEKNVFCMAPKRPKLSTGI